MKYSKIFRLLALLAVAVFSLNAAAQQYSDDETDVLMNQVQRELNEGGDEGIQRLFAAVKRNDFGNWSVDQQTRCFALLTVAADDGKIDKHSWKRLADSDPLLKKQKNSADAILAVCDLIESGNGVPERPQVAFSLLKNLMSQKTFHPAAAYEYACMLLDGYGTQPDAATAVNLLIKCAEAGYKPALRELSLACKEQGLVVNDSYLQFLMREGNHYDSFNRLKNGFIQVERDGRHGVIDRQGKIIVSPLYDRPVYLETEGLTEVEQNGKFGFINERGDVVISPRYLAATEFREGLAVVYDSDGWVILDKAGNERMIDNFDAIRSFSNGKAIVTLKSKKGAIDKTGKIVVVPQYEDMGDFGCNMAAVKKGSKWGYVDDKGQLVIPCRYDRAEPFVNPDKPFALVVYKGKEMCIDKKGKKKKI